MIYRVCSPTRLSGHQCAPPWEHPNGRCAPRKHFTGIIESNYASASAYWLPREFVLDAVELGGK